jgi:hypothetical protein
LPTKASRRSRIRQNSDRIVGQIYHARRLGAAGFTIFNFSPDVAEAILPGVGIGAGAQRAKTPE